MPLSRRRTLLLGAAGVGLAALPARLLAQAATPAPAAPAFLMPVEHASLMLSLDGAHLLVDPVGRAARYQGLPPPSAILVTHEHGDHFDPDTLTALAGDSVALIVNPAVADKLPEALKSGATVLRNGDTGEAAGLRIEAVPAYNTTPDRQKYHPQGRDNGYVITSREHGRIYVAGDTEDTPEFRAQKDIAALLVPMNLPYTMPPEQAAQGVAAMAPKMAIPYHHKGSDPQVFADALGAAGAQTQVVILDWYPAVDDPTGKDG
ncbi:MAG TPA: MBL fold metallo-hydrolase [Paracoccus sp. (in: a-proteobacteria)]|nr:MBL fold metallo-hydrolase [Paracoccus sp. (in: a-proteobacteria)]